MQLYISRLFVEFGPFEVNEIQSFIQRGLLSESDYLRIQGTEDWINISDWTPNATYQPKFTPAVITKKTAPTKVAAKKAAATKTAKKKIPLKKTKATP